MMKGQKNGSKSFSPIQSRGIWQAEYEGATQEKRLKATYPSSLQLAQAERSRKHTWHGENDDSSMLIHGIVSLRRIAYEKKIKSIYLVA